MESLFDLIWEPETMSLSDEEPMKQACMICLCSVKGASSGRDIFIDYEPKGIVIPD